MECPHRHFVIQSPSAARYRDIVVFFPPPRFKSYAERRSISRVDSTGRASTTLMETLPSQISSGSVHQSIRTQVRTALRHTRLSLGFRASCDRPTHSMRERYPQIHEALIANLFLVDWDDIRPSAGSSVNKALDHKDQGTWTDRRVIDKRGNIPICYNPANRSNQATKSATLRTEASLSLSRRSGRNLPSWGV